LEKLDIPDRSAISVRREEPVRPDALEFAEGLEWPGL